MGDYSHCSCVLVLGIKLGLYGSLRVTNRLVLWPTSFLTFRGAISYASASTTIHRFAAFHARVVALQIEAQARLWGRLHFFVFLIKTGAGNALSEEFHKRVHVKWVLCVKYFGGIK